MFNLFQVEALKLQLQELKKKNEEERKKMSEKLSFELWKKNHPDLRQVCQGLLGSRTLLELYSKSLLLSQGLFILVSISLPRWALCVGLPSRAYEETQAWRSGAIDLKINFESDDLSDDYPLHNPYFVNPFIINIILL